MALNLCEYLLFTLDKKVSKLGRSFLLSIMKGFQQNAAQNRSPMMPINNQVTQTSSLHAAIDQETLNNDAAKQKVNSSPDLLSIRSKLRQLTFKSDIDPLATDKNDATLSSKKPSKDPLQLVDLIPDCLQYIFDELSIPDLIKLAGTCVYFQNNVLNFFQTQAKSYEIILDCNEYPRFIIKMRSNRWPHVYNGRDFMAFIERLNEIIEKITIINMFPLRADQKRLQNDAKIERMIVKELAKKPELRELKFIRCGRRTLVEHTSVEFRVEKVSFERCTFGSSAFDWPNLFPNMQHLSVIDCDVSMARECIEKSFQHLTAFDLTASYVNENTWFDCTFSIPNVQRVIDENPNIRKLALCYWNQSAYDAKLLGYAAEHLPMLQSLHLVHLKYSEFFSEGDINFMYVRKFTLSNDYFQSEKLNQNLASLTFFSLQKFCLFGHYDAECVAFLARHQSIQKFVCQPNGEHVHYPTDSDISTFGNVLPQLKVLCISGNLLTRAGLIQFISDCQTVSLIKIRNLVFSPPICEQFGKDCMEHGWKASFVLVDNVPKIIMKKK